MKSSGLVPTANVPRACQGPKGNLVCCNTLTNEARPENSASELFVFRIFHARGRRTTSLPRYSCKAIPSKLKSFCNAAPRFFSLSHKAGERRHDATQSSTPFPHAVDRNRSYGHDRCIPWALDCQLIPRHRSCTNWPLQRSH